MQGVQGQREDDDDGAEFSFAGSHSIDTKKCRIICTRMQTDRRKERYEKSL
jgi:hypothetical protein